MLLALNPPPDPAQAIPADRFTENRIGLDHLSLSVASMADLKAAVGVLDAKGVTHGEIKPLGSRYYESSMLNIFRRLEADNFQTVLIERKEDIWPSFKAFLAKDRGKNNYQFYTAQLAEHSAQQFALEAPGQLQVLFERLLLLGGGEMTPVGHGDVLHPGLSASHAANAIHQRCAGHIAIDDPVRARAHVALGALAGAVPHPDHL